MFSAFGNIKACELASAGVPGRHKGYGYIEYDTLQSAQVGTLWSLLLLQYYECHSSFTFL